MNNVAIQWSGLTEGNGGGEHVVFGSAANSLAIFPRFPSGGAPVVSPEFHSRIPLGVPSVIHLEAPSEIPSRILPGFLLGFQETSSGISPEVLGTLQEVYLKFS